MDFNGTVTIGFTGGQVLSLVLIVVAGSMLGCTLARALETLVAWIDSKIRK